MDFGDLMRQVDKQPQRQDSLREQLGDLIVISNHLGMYDAADYLARKYFEEGLDKYQSYSITIKEEGR